MAPDPPALDAGSIGQGHSDIDGQGGASFEERRGTLVRVDSDRCERGAGPQPDTPRRSPRHRDARRLRQRLEIVEHQGWLQQFRVDGALRERVRWNEIGAAGQDSVRHGCIQVVLDVPADLYAATEAPVHAGRALAKDQVPDVATLAAQIEDTALTPPISLDSRLATKRGPERKGRNDPEERGEGSGRRPFGDTGAVERGTEDGSRLGRGPRARRGGDSSEEALIDVGHFIWFGGGHPVCNRVVHPEIDQGAYPITRSEGVSLHRRTLLESSDGHPIPARHQHESW